MPESADTDKLLDRVRKLLALASSDNVHEAALAATRAQELIEAHRLEALLAAEAAARAVDAEAQDGLGSGGGLGDRADPLDESKRLRKWRVVLASRLAELNGCIAYTEQRGRLKRLLLVGRPEDRLLVRELYTWLCQRLEWLSATHAPASSAGKADKRWHEAFRIGAADVIVDRLEEARRERRASLPEAAPARAALARLDASVAARAAQVSRYAEEHLDLRPGRRILVDADGYARGKAEGARFELPEEG